MSRKSIYAAGSASAEVALPVADSTADELEGAVVGAADSAGAADVAGAGASEAAGADAGGVALAT